MAENALVCGVTEDVVVVAVVVAAVGIAGTSDIRTLVVAASGTATHQIAVYIHRSAAAVPCWGIDDGSFCGVLMIVASVGNAVDSDSHRRYSSGATCYPKVSTLPYHLHLFLIVHYMA